MSVADSVTAPASPLGVPLYTIGGSEAAAAIGLDPFRSRAMLWAEKTGRVEREPTEAMEWGTRLEPVIIEALRLHGHAVGSNRTRIESDALPWLVGTPDGVTVDEDGETIGVEIKTGSAWGAHDWKDGEAPAHYVVQVQHYMALTGWPRFLLAVLLGGQKLETRMVERDEALIEAMLTAEEDFLGYLVRDECPPFVGSDSDAAVLAALHPSPVEGLIVRADRELVEVAKDARLWYEARQKADARYKECSQRLQAAMGDAERLVAPSDVELATWKASSRTAVDVTKLKAEAPHVHKTYSKTTTSRTFRLS